MIEFHPSPTAGSGREIFKSRHPNPNDPVDRRIECAQCGWRFNPDQQSQGDTGGDDSSGGVEVQDVSHSFSNTEAGLPIHLRGIATFTASSRTVKDPVVQEEFGCPFCGSTNPKAFKRYPDIMFARRDYSNL